MLTLPALPAIAVLLIALAAGLPPARSQAPAPAADPDVATVKERMRAALLPRQPADRQDVASRAQALLATLRPDGTWPDIAYANATRSGWRVAEHLDRTHLLAKAYALPDQPLYHDPALRAGILRAIDTWLAHDYQNPNWWWNEIGVPQMIGEICLLMEPDLSPDEMAKGLAILARSRPRPGQGQNTVWLAGNTVVRGLLEGRPDVVTDAFNAIYGEVHVARPPQEGIQVDESFHQHGDQLYNGGYGLAFGNDVGRYIAHAWGTRFQIPDDRMRVFVDYLLDGQQWMVRGKVFDYSAVGREITRAGKVALPGEWTRGPISPAGAAYGLLNTADLMAALPVPRRAEFAAFAARLRNAPGAPPLSGNRHFWKSDYMAHHRPGFFMSVKMLSSRMLSAEVVNDEGKKSFHLSDGATFLYKTGDEYRDIFPVWDWNRIPGTTAEVWSPMPPPAKVQVRGRSAFVGGVSDGHYGMAAMDLERDSLSARKAWFFFDTCVAALGAGITDTSGFPVLTSVEQAWARGPVRVDGARGPVSGERALNGARWVLHDGTGYLFPAGQKVMVRDAVQTGRWSEIGTGSANPLSGEVFSLWIDHGPHPDGASYSCVVMPEATPQRLSVGSPVRILCNTPDLQAVFDPEARVLQAAFYAPGMVDAGRGWTLAADHPCLVQVRADGERTVVAVSNPENAPLTVHLATDRGLVGQGAEPAGGGTRLTLTLPGGDLAGSSLVRTFSDG